MIDTLIRTPGLTDTDYRAFALYLDGGPVESIEGVSVEAITIAHRIKPPAQGTSGWSAKAAFIQAVAELYETAAAERIWHEVIKRDPRATPPKSEEEALEASLWWDEKVLTASFPEPKWIIPDLLPVGLGFLSGKPKSGKSWMSLQAAQAIGHGGKMFGVDVSKRKCFYAACEDPMPRLQTRLRLQYASPSNSVAFVNEMPAFGAGCLERLILLHEVYSFELFILDTLSRLMPPDAEQNSTDDMTRLLGPIQKWAVDNDVCVLILDHKKKGAMDSQDHWEGNLGATGKIAVADFNWSLAREFRGSKKATLRVGGRDITKEWEVPLRFDDPTCTWQPDGARREAGEEDPEKDANDPLLLALETLGGKASRKKLADEAKMSYTGALRRLEELKEAGLVRQDGKKGSDWVLSSPLNSAEEVE